LAAGVRLNPDTLEWRQVEGEIVALDLGAHEYVSVNRTGTAIWPSLAEGATRDELAGVLAERFGIGVEDAARDVDAFLAQLSERGLLEDV
jgi:hypothetical protein